MNYNSTKYGDFDIAPTKIGFVDHLIPQYYCKGLLL